jgi:aspartyl-tRNA(Asn)/glutamyl-tRNA(Gln) amidotransferase subunit A
VPDWGSISKIASDVNNGKVKAEDLVLKSLEIIEQHKEFNAIISLVKERALERAKQIDLKINKGEIAGRLAGVPFIAKDNFLTFGGETTAASNILKGFNAPYQSTAVEKLEQEGAICVAKANLDAFAHGSSTENSDLMTTRNPHDINRVPGGSSGGSAAAVVLGMAPFALGTDTGGSIRLPASFTGSVGLKPTYGTVSRSGVVAMASSTDVIGPITNSVEDAALVLDVIAGQDPLDGTTIPRSSKSFLLEDINLKGQKIGLVKEYLGEGVDDKVKNSVLASIEELKKSGVQIKEVSLPSIYLSLACYYIIMPAEVSSNLSRYDGQRYGYSSDEAKTLEESYNWSRSEGFGREAKRRIMIGTYVLSSGYYDDYYLKAMQVRTKLINEFNKVFEEVDYLIGPTAPTTAFEVGKKTDNPLEMYLADIMTVAPSLVGVPAVSIPIRSTDKMPVGLQIIAPQGQDKNLLSLSNKIMEITK